MLSEFAKATPFECKLSDQSSGTISLDPELFLENYTIENAIDTKDTCVAHEGATCEPDLSLGCAITKPSRRETAKRYRQRVKADNDNLKKELETLRNEVTRLQHKNAALETALRQALVNRDELATVKARNGELLRRMGSIRRTLECIVSDCGAADGMIPCLELPMGIDLDL